MIPRENQITPNGKVWLKKRRGFPLRSFVFFSFGLSAVLTGGAVAATAVAAALPLLPSEDTGDDYAHDYADTAEDQEHLPKDLHNDAFPFLTVPFLL